MNPLEYLHLQLRLEGKEVVEGDRLRQVDVVPGEELPLMILALLADGPVLSYYDESLSDERYTELKKRTAESSFPVIDPLLDFLSAAEISVEVGHYRTYIFPHQVVASTHPDVENLPSDHPLVQAFGFGGSAGSVYAVERGGGIVSACMSVRENEQCGEAWVYTDPPYRHLGLARQVISAWAQSMIASGKVPFYSHKMTNIASANLANRLELQPVFEEIAISYMTV